MHEFNDRVERWLIFALASFLEISPEDITIKAIRSGSVNVTLAMPAAAAAKLERAVAMRSSELAAYLDGLKVTSVSRGTENYLSRSVEIRFFGRIAAGRPIEVLSGSDTIAVPRLMLTGDPALFYALKVVGDSLVEAGVSDGDMIIVERTVDVMPGDLVVLLVGDDATLKYYHLEGDSVVLTPANSTMSPVRLPSRDVRISGKVVALLRDYRLSKDKGGGSSER